LYDIEAKDELKNPTIALILQFLERRIAGVSAIITKKAPVVSP
jgi:hypothetical protein